MKCYKSIPLNLPLRNVLLLNQAPAEDWEAHLRDREQAAYERGRREGELAHREHAAHGDDQAREQLNTLVESLRQAVPQVIQETETALIHLAIEAARKVVAGLSISAQMIETVVREALQEAKDSANVTVQLHPDDLALLRDSHSALIGESPETGPLKFTVSPEVTRGGCLMHTRFGVIDARRETKFEQLHQTLAV